VTLLSWMCNVLERGPQRKTRRLVQGDVKFWCPEKELSRMTTTKKI